ncbi:MAG: PHP domain-containing protein, partial [Pseudomonadota bacterium]
MFTELSATSNFTFLTGASHPEEYMARAALLGMEALAIADDNSVAGIVRAHTQSKAIARSVKERQEFDAITGLIGPPRPDHIPAPPRAPITLVPRLIPGARLVFRDAPPITVLPQNRAGWRSLCRIISAGRLRAEKGQCDIGLDDLEAFPEGLCLLLWPQEQTVPGGAVDWVQTAQRLTRRFAGNIHVLMCPRYDGRDTLRFDRIADRARDLGLPTLASAAPRMHHGARRKLADVVTAVRLKTRVDALGRAALANGEGRLRSEADMRRIFAGHEGAVARTGVLAQSLTFSLDELRYEYPSEITDNE